MLERSMTESNPRLRFPAAAVILALVFLLTPLSSPRAQAPGETGSNVLVLPFSVHAGQDLDHLRKDVPELLSDALRKQGLTVVSRQKTLNLLQEREVEVIDLGTARDLATLAGADYAVYGSLSQVGETLSLDARLVEPYKPEAVRALYVSREGLIQLGPAVQELAAKIDDSIMQRRSVARIEVQGNRTLGKDFVLMRLSIREGDVYNPEKINREVKKLYETGYFQDIRVHANDTPQGKEVVFEVKEKPLIRDIVVKGADAVDKDDILEAMSTKTGSVLNPKVIQEDLDKVRELYRKKGYYKAEVSYSQQTLSPGKAELVLDIEEGEKLYIKEITIQGADKLDADDLKDQLALSERGFFSWLTGRGVLKQELLDRDAAALEAYYANRGFFDVKVGQPQVSFREDGIYITFQVSEGPRYEVGNVRLEGDLITDPAELKKHIRTDDLAQEDSFFDRSVLRDDTQSLAEYYTNYGYAFAEASVDLSKDTEERTIDVTFVLHKKQKVFIRRVLITGNYKTRDNVIRRQMRLSDGDQFSGALISRSKTRLNKLGYFESVDIETVPAERKDRLDLKVKVKERSTGSLSAGAGYSSVNQVFFTGKVQERNLFGKGYSLSFQGTLGGTRNLFQLSFWNPHLWDSPVGMGFDAYRSEFEYDDYDVNTTGGRMKTAYTIGEYTRLFWNYRLEQYSVDNVDEDASQEIKDLTGDNLSSSTRVSATRDTTDRRLFPTAGSKNTLGLEYSGGVIGGDDNYIKATYEFSYFYNPFWELVLSWHWRAGHLFENTSEAVPDFERFYLGGLDSVRGYDYRDIAATDDEGKDIGGYKSFYTNVEAVFPIIGDMGLMGVMFFDAGDVWGRDEEIEPELFKSVGGGIRWNSPVGPIRMEYGYPLDDLKDNNGKFEFSVGQPF
jgi:outer membrane protein insertion porin family